MNITAETKINILIGDPIRFSLSPQMHNAAYEALHINTQYVYVGCLITENNLETCIKGLKLMNINGITIKTPHKVTIMQYLDALDETAEKIGAVNTVINKKGKLVGYNTDWIGVIEPLKMVSSLKNKKVGLLGAGGAAQAAAYGITKLGGNLTIFNRTIKKAQKIADNFAASIKSLDELETIRNADIIINASSIGHPPHQEATPVPSEYLSDKQTVYDLVYSPNQTTQLIKDAREKGAHTLTGIEMLLHQGFAQFKLFTGLAAPEKVMRKVIEVNE